MNLGQKNMLYSLKKLSQDTPITATSPKRPLSSVPKEAAVERLDFE